MLYCRTRLAGRGGCWLQASVAAGTGWYHFSQFSPKSQLPTPFPTLFSLVEGTTNFQVIFLAQTRRGEGGQGEKDFSGGPLFLGPDLTRRQERWYFCFCHCWTDSSQTAMLWSAHLSQAANV